jgi:hypothetical protein
MSSEEAEGASPQWGITPCIGQRDSGRLAGSPSARLVGHRTGHKPMPRGGSRLWSNRRERGVLCSST